MSEENQDLLENIIMKFLFTDEKLRDKVVPYLKYSIFEIVENVQLIKFVKKFMNKYGKFPNVKETRLKIKNPDVYRHLKQILRIDTDEYSTDVILYETEDFIRQKCIMEVCFKVVENVQNEEMDKVSSTPDEMREALAFSFDSTVGLDVFADDSEQKMYYNLHSVDHIVSTGLESFDELIDGGFHEKTLNLIMAETNMGKSLIMGALATNNIFAGKKVLYVTCEMSEYKISERVLSNSFDHSTKDLKKMTRSKFGQCFKRAKEQIKGRLVVKEYPTGIATVNHIRNLVKETELKKGFKPDIIYVDYIGIMASTYKSKSDNTYTIQKRITEEIRGLAVELGIPIVSAIQTNRLGMGEDELDLTNTSDSIGTAFTADVIIGVTQPDGFKEAGKYRWMIIKNRYGPNKVGMNVRVNYSRMRLTDDDAIKERFGYTDDESPVPKKTTPKKRTSTEGAKPKNRKIIRRGDGKKKAKIEY